MLQIVTYPNEILRETCQEIENPTDPEIKQLVSEMTASLRANDGVGLAAPQIGKNLRLCVIEIEDELFVLINPKIKKLSEKKVIMEEGCLSFPGKFLPVARAERVKVVAVDSNGKKQVIRAKGLLARALQHEIDHLDGKLFIDLAEQSQNENNESILEVAR